MVFFISHNPDPLNIDITTVMFSNELKVYIGGHGHMAEGDG
jgi:hypothetical protein